MAKEVQMWQCPLTKKVFKDEESAERCTRSAKAARTRKANKEKERKKLLDLTTERRKYICENASSFQEIFDMVVEKSKEFWGIEFESLLITGAGLSQNRDDGSRYIGFRIEVSTKPLTKETKRQIDSFYKTVVGGDPRFLSVSISSLFQGKGEWLGNSGIGFLGIGVGSGNPGRFGEYRLAMDGKVFVDMFPKLKERLEVYNQFKSASKDYANSTQEIDMHAQQFSRSSKDYKQLEVEVAQLQAEVEKKRKALNSVFTAGIEIYRRIGLSGIEHLAPRIDDKLRADFEDMSYRL